MFALLQAYQTGGNRGPLVFTACAPEEWHEVGVLLVSVFLARRGLVVRYLGPSLPLEALAAIAARHHPAAIVLSRAELRNGPQGARFGDAAGGPRTETVLFFGGQAFNAESRLRAEPAHVYRPGRDRRGGNRRRANHEPERLPAPTRWLIPPVFGNNRRRTLA